MIPSSLGITALLISTIVALVFSLLLVFELRLPKMVRRVGEDLKGIEGQILEYQSYTKYMAKRERIGHGKRLNSILSHLQFLRKSRRLLDAQRRTLVGQYDSKVKHLLAFLDQFIPEYTKREVERHKTFFAFKSFDREQTEAIIKKDEFNLVIAGAGSGKTRTLTGRYAFLIESGASPNEILALAYTKSAAEEMEHRLRDEYHIKGANVRTFHSLGRELARRSPTFRNDVADGPEQIRLIKESLTRLLSDQPGFASRLLDFVVKWQTPEVKPEKFPDKEKYYEFLGAQRYTTLDSREVKSIAERDIVNFLILNQVKVEYETPAAWADTNSEFRQYRPDFFLPEYGIWIEHFAMDGKGNVPPWFSARGATDPSEGYRSGMEWKRTQFKKHGRKLIETYYHQWSDDTLIDELKRHLEENAVVLRELKKEEILDLVYQHIPREDYLHELMFSFVNKAKTNTLGINDIKSRLHLGGWNRKQRAFANLMISIWEEYELLMKEGNMIDFSDMINYALQVIKQEHGHSITRYPHILVDEFQDITDPQLELLKCLVSENGGSTLFCVGDYRQNIFSFAGSDINNILEFENMFPYAETTVLPTNYRCPRNIVEASDVVANLNKMKLKGNTVAASNVDGAMSLVERSAGGSFSKYDDWEFRKGKELLAGLIESKKRGEDILVLARSNYVFDQLKLEFPHSEDVGLRFLTIHRAKGLEADYVVLLGCVSGKYGFPSWVFDDDILDIVKKKQESKSDRIEEERRLFYVALTRCKNQFFVFTSKGRRSEFVGNIEQYLTVKSS